MTDEEMEKRAAAAEDVAGEAITHRPEPASIGLFVYGDASPAIGGGVGGFLWFVDRAHMLAFVREHLVFFSSGPVADDPMRVLTQVESLIDEAPDPRRDLELIAALNKALRHYSQIEWWGSLSELLAGGGEFVRRVRVWFWEQECDEQGIEDVIPADEADAFVAAISDYGL